MKKPVLIVLIALLIPTFLLAQEEPTPKKYDNPEWYRIVHIKFKTGQIGEYLKLIEDHFRPVAAKLGRSGPTTYIPISGEWDLIQIFRLSEGMSGYEWETSPGSIEWNNELIKQSGGKEKANEIRAQIQNCILERKVEIIRKKVW